MYVLYLTRYVDYGIAIKPWCWYMTVLYLIFFAIRGPSWSWSYGFTTSYAISAYHHVSCELESRSWRCVLDITLCDKACQWLSPPPIKNTDLHDITKILLKVVLNTITPTLLLFSKLCDLNRSMVFRLIYLMYITTLNLARYILIYNALSPLCSNNLL